MIVNSKIFSYKLIIGTLLISLIVLGFFSISNYNSLKNNQEFIKQEKLLVQNELNEMIKSYDNLKIESKTINNELIEIKTELETVLSSLVESKPNVSLISEYKNKMSSLKKERLDLFEQAQLIKDKNDSLQEELNSLSLDFYMQKQQLLGFQGENKRLSLVLGKIKSLTARNINAIAFKTTNTEDIETNKINELDNFKICFMLLNSPYTPIGNKNIYVQIFNPENQLVVDNGTVKFEGSYLNYSGKTVVNNKTNDLAVCVKTHVTSKDLLKKGVYNVRIFQDNFPIANTQLELN